MLTSPGSRMQKKVTKLPLGTPSCEATSSIPSGGPTDISILRPPNTATIVFLFCHFKLNPILCIFRLSPGEAYIVREMAAMAMMQCANFATSTKVSFSTRGNARLPAARRVSLVVRAAGDPERIDKFFDGAKQEASKNASNFGDQVAKAAGDVERTIKDVGRDMGGKTQEALDAAGGRADEMAGELDDARAEVANKAKNPLNTNQSVADAANDAKRN